MNVHVRWLIACKAYVHVGPLLQPRALVTVDAIFPVLFIPLSGVTT